MYKIWTGWHVSLERSKRGSRGGLTIDAERFGGPEFHQSVSRNYGTFVARDHAASP
jgi:hypothetical protein